MGSVNYLAVVVCAALAMGIGFAWYGPLFGKPWQRMMGFTEKDIADAQEKGMGKSMTIMAIGSLFMAFVMASMIIFASTFMNMSGVAVGITVAILAWIGFVAPVSLGTVLWENKPWKLWGINAGYYLVLLIVEGIVFGLWM